MMISLLQFWLLIPILHSKTLTAVTGGTLNSGGVVRIGHLLVSASFVMQLMSVNKNHHLLSLKL